MLDSLQPNPAARAQGVARAPFEAVHTRADAESAPAVWWLIQGFNYPGRMLHDQIGVKTPFIRCNLR